MVVVVISLTDDNDIMRLKIYLEAKWNIRARAFVHLIPRAIANL